MEITNSMDGDIGTECGAEYMHWHSLNHYDKMIRLFSVVVLSDIVPKTF